MAKEAISPTVNERPVNPETNFEGRTSDIILALIRQNVGNGMRPRDIAEILMERKATRKGSNVVHSHPSSARDFRDRAKSYLMMRPTMNAFEAQSVMWGSHVLSAFHRFHERSFIIEVLRLIIYFLLPAAAKQVLHRTIRFAAAPLFSAENLSLCRE